GRDRRRVRHHRGGARRRPPGRPVPALGAARTGRAGRAVRRGLPRRGRRGGRDGGRAARARAGPGPPARGARDVLGDRPAGRGRPRPSGQDQSGHRGGRPRRIRPGRRHGERRRGDPMSTPEGFRSGFVSFVGRPNTGKSTLTNALVGEKIAITSSRPQTTRHAIRGLVHRPDSQIILVDTPGLHRPRTLLGERLNALVEDTYTEVDLIGMCFPAGERIGPGDRWILDQVRSLCPTTPLVGIVTKIDAVSKPKVVEQLVAVSEFLGTDCEVVPVSATAGEQVDVVADVIASLLPEGPRFYPEDMVTEESDESRMSELIREAALEGVRDELPHSIAVTIEE